MASFRKRAVRMPIPGTRTSSQTAQIITSSGNPSVDVILGGGVPIGSLFLIEEDKHVTYSKVLAKYFMAEGVLSKQSIFLASLDDTPKELLKKLPKHCSEVVSEEEDSARPDTNQLRIAFRYDDLPMVSSENTTEVIGHHFNLTEFMDPKLLKFAHTVTWSDDPSDNTIDQDEIDEDWNFRDSGNNADNESDNTFEMDSSNEPDLEKSNPDPALSLDENQDISEDKNVTGSSATSATISIPVSIIEKELQVVFKNVKFYSLLNELQKLLNDERFHSTGIVVKRSLCRVCITSLGSPQWYEDENFGEDLLKFLTILRAGVRSVVAVCFITMPMHLIAKYDETLVAKIRNLVDYSMELETFAGSEKETNPAFKEYNGIFKLHKMTALNTLSAYVPETTDLAFRLKRKKFVIEKLHLPPELQDDSTAQPDARPTISCGSNINSNPKVSYDF